MMLVSTCHPVWSEMTSAISGGIALSSPPSRIRTGAMMITCFSLASAFFSRSAIFFGFHQVPGHPQASRPVPRLGRAVIGVAFQLLDGRMGNDPCRFIAPCGPLRHEQRKALGQGRFPSWIRVMGNEGTDLRTVSGRICKGSSDSTSGKFFSASPGIMPVSIWLSSTFALHFFRTCSGNPE